MPHLNDISKKYADKGVVVTGLNIFEEREPKDDSYVAKVEKYVKDFGDGMSFNVVTDDPKGTNADAWMKASGNGGIPTTFVVDGKGTIIWIGHPMELGSSLDKMLDGTYDLQAEKQKKEDAKKLQEEMRAKFAPINKAAAAKDYKTAVAEVDKIYAKSGDMKTQLGMTKFMFLFNYDEPGAYKWAKVISEDFAKDDANMLNSIAWSIVDDAAKPERKKPDFPLAIKIAERANKLSKNENAFYMDTLGLAYFRGGQLKKAIVTQELAVAIAVKTSGFDAATLKELKDRLTMMKAK